MHGSCARRLEQHDAVGGDPLMTAGAHTASCVGLHCCADAPPALVAATTTNAMATSIATAFAVALGARVPLLGSLPSSI